MERLALLPEKTITKRNFQLGIIFGKCSDFSKLIFFPDRTDVKESKDYLNKNRGNATLCAKAVRVVSIFS